jgi:hypothetical protein
MKFYSQQLTHFFNKSTKFIRVGCLLSAIIVLMLTAACTRSTHATYTNIDEPKYANALLESLLQLRNKNDFIGYSSYFYPSIRDGLTEERFNDSTSFTKEAFGDYIPGTIQYINASLQYNNNLHWESTVVSYQAKFTNDPAREVLVEIVFWIVKNDVFVESLSFGSTNYPPEESSVSE